MAQAALEFMNRVELKATEVDAFVVVREELRREANPPAEPEREDDAGEPE